MRPRLFDQVENIQIRTGNKREVRIARLTFSEPNSGTPLIEPVQVTYEGVPAERVPKVSVNGVSQHGTAEVGTKLTAIFNETWEEEMCIRDRSMEHRWICIVLMPVILKHQQER